MGMRLRAIIGPKRPAWKRAQVEAAPLLSYTNTAAKVHAASKWRPQCHHALRWGQRDLALGRALMPMETAYGQLYREVRV